jgi:nitrate reductase gamma subunit
MPDTTAIELEAREISPAVPTRLIDHALKFVTGALFSAALVAGGAVLVTVALTVGVVGAPVIVAAIVALVVRRRRAVRARELAGLAPSPG